MTRNVADDASNPNKTSIHDNDRFKMVDSEANPNSYKETLWSIIKSTLKTYFDTLYQAIGVVSQVGRVEFLAAVPPATSGAPLNVAAGASTPAEQIPYYEFVNGSVTYRDFLCRLVGYNGGGLTLSGQVLRTTGGAGETYILEAAIRRIVSGTEDLGASHTYDFNQVTVTIPAGPPNAGIPMAVTIAFTDGADMDSLADGEFFVLRVRRNGGTAADTARVLANISVVETE